MRKARLMNWFSGNRGSGARRGATAAITAGLLLFASACGSSSSPSASTGSSTTSTPQGQSTSPSTPANSSAGSTANAATPTSVQTFNLVNTKYAAEALPITAGISRGIFKKHGIDLHVTQASTSSVASAALISGRADLGLMQSAFVVSTDAAGGDLKLVGQLLDQLDYHIITAKGIKSLSDLVGKKMGDPGANNGNTATMKAVMDKAGYGADKLTYVTVGAQAAILAALQANQVQVGLLVAPFTIQARAAGLNDLGTVEKYLPNNTAAAFAGTTATLQKKADLVRNFLAAVLESTQWVAQNPTDAITLLMSSDKLTKDVATEDYNEVKDIYTKTGKIDPDGLTAWIQVATKYGVMKTPIPVEGLFTNEYLPQ